MRVAGTEQHFGSPAASQEAGISTVYQEVNLCTNLTVAENMMLGREPRRFGGIHTRAMNRQAAATLERLGLDIDPASQLGEHPIAVQQLVAIARAVDVECKVLILDEPTSSLDADEVAKLFEVMRTLRDQGVAIVFVSHFLDQVFEISDRMTVLRNGALVGERTDQGRHRARAGADDDRPRARGARTHRPRGRRQRRHRDRHPGAEGPRA